MSLLDSERFSPTIFLGLGGSGSKVVNALAGKLRRHPNFARFRELIHFVAIDTNKADLNAQGNIPDANRFLVSSFDRRAYVRRKRGEAELTEDPMVTQWVHDGYQFRDTQGAGAGQIRVESRLGLYYNLEEDRARIRSSLQRLLDASTKPDNPFRDNRDRVVNVMVYASVAGGTGSGGFLPMAYLVQDIVQDHGWGRPNVVGTLMLPSLFLQHVEQALHADINANGYAALKELEFLTRLGYEGGIDEVEFHYDPTRPERTHVSRRPFSLVYLVDKPAEIAIERYTNAVADSAFLQIFSPIIGSQAGEYDNYEKHQKTLALGHFSVHYGTFGAAVLIFPRKDVLHYSALRYVSKTLDSYLSLGADEQFRVPWDDPKFQRLARQEQDRVVDEKFGAFVQHQARLEEDRQERGVYTGIRDLKTAEGHSLFEAFQRRLAGIFDALEERIEIEPFDPLQVHENNTSLARSVEHLRRDVAQSRSRVMGEYLQSQLADLRSDRFFGEFFRANKVDPLAQRYFLVQLKAQGALTPFEDASEGTFLFETKENPYDLDKEHTSRELSDLERRLNETSQRGFVKSLLSRENKEFQSVRRKVQDFFAQVEGGVRDWLKAGFWQAFHEELQKNVEARLSAFRNVAQIADETVRAAQTEAQRFLADPASSKDYAAEAAEYYLDNEVLRDDRAGVRLWDRFFEHYLDRSAYYDEEKIFDAITRAFQPATGDDGRVRARDANEIVREIRRSLYELGRDTFDGVVREMKLDLSRALELEARYVATSRTPQDREAVDRVDERVVAEHVRQKFQLVLDQCVLLANIDQTKLDDPTVKPNKIFYAGLASRYATDEPGSLKNLLREVTSGLQLVPWEEEEMVVFYRALIGVPVYFFRRANEELSNHYRAVKARPNRTYPLHIEKVWEDGLPNLDPKELREAEERRQREEAAARAQKERSEKLWTFSLCTFFGNIQRADAGYDWVLGTVRKKLAPDRATAFEAFQLLDGALRKDLERKVIQGLGERTTSVADKRRFREDLASHLAQISELYYQALAEERDREKRFLEEEKGLLETRIEELPA